MDQVSITRIDQGGFGQTADGRSFARTLPGEVIEVDEAGDFRIVTPSADRVAPPCRHFKTCGGCAMQHGSDEFVAEWKTGILRQGLLAQGLEPEFRPILTSPAQSRRRCKFTGRRTKKGALVGFYAKGSDVLIPVPDCELVRPALRAIVPALEVLTKEIGTRKGEMQFTVTDTVGGPDLFIEASKPLDPQMRIYLAGFAERFNFARVVWQDEPIVTRVLPIQSFGLGQVVPPPGAFLQATSDGERDLLRGVEECVGDAKKIVDLFAGCGTFSLPMAQKAEVHAVESEASMLEALDVGWRKTQGVKKLSTEARDLFRRPLYPDEFRKVDAVVIDPPRAGAEAQCVQLAQSNVPVIAFVSCNPVSFARDAKILVDGGYHIDWVQPIDQFRWAAHVELVARFTRKPA